MRRDAVKSGFGRGRCWLVDLALSLTEKCVFEPDANALAALHALALERRGQPNVAQPDVPKRSIAHLGEVSKNIGGRDLRPSPGTSQRRFGPVAPGQKSSLWASGGWPRPKRAPANAALMRTPSKYRGLARARQSDTRPDITVISSASFDATLHAERRDPQKGLRSQHRAARNALAHLRRVR